MDKRTTTTTKTGLGIAELFCFRTFIHRLTKIKVLQLASPASNILHAADVTRHTALLFPLMSQSCFPHNIWPSVNGSSHTHLLQPGSQKSV